jgi:hypothetical protein
LYYGSLSADGSGFLGNTSNQKNQKMSDWFYNLMGKVQSGFASIVSAIGILGGIIGWLGGSGVLLFQGGYWLLEGKSISILINDIIPTPQYFIYTFKGVHKIIDWIFEPPLVFGLIIFGLAIGWFLIWLAEQIKDENM